MIYYKDDDITLYHGKMQDVLSTIPENSIDSIVCDPPYELGFMGRKWDSSGVAFQVDTWEQCLRVLKPGGYLLAFGGTRTYHRMTCAIEDAGFEIRDCLMWLYGSGFPKSMNIGKAVESLEIYGATDTRHKRQVEQSCEGETIFVRQTNNGAMGEIKEVTRKEYIPSTDLAKKWTGWGTCLKPAYEPIIMARKPMSLTVAQNCLLYGVGGINIDECRVGSEEIKGGTMPDLHDVGVRQKALGNGHKMSFGQIENAERLEYESHIGRFPANVITDGSEEVASGMPITKSMYNENGEHETNIHRENADVLKYGYNERYETGFNDEGSALRYFYTAKASKKDRDDGLNMFESMQTTDGCIRANSETVRKFGANSALRKNIHPTVKPVELMQYLVRLVSPKGATILDCFMGSGSTGKAVMFENREREAHYKFIGVEMTEEYLPIAQARIIYGRDKYEYEFNKEIEDIHKAGEKTLFDFIKGEDV